MEKTTYYQLNKPEVTDPMRLADFNENADKIDAALKLVDDNSITRSAQVRSEAADALAALNTSLTTLAGTVPKIAVGTYKGTGAAAQAITLGFHPKALYAMAVRTQPAGTLTATYTALAVEGTDYTNALTITDTGFTAIYAENMNGSTYFPSMNVSGLTYVYVAFG